MSIIKQNRWFAFIVLMFIIGAIFFTSPVYAADEPAQAAAEPTEAAAEPTEAALIVKEVWLTGDTLHINVSDRDTGAEQTLELNLMDYAKTADEYVTVQATNSAGRTSNSVSFKNPYFEPIPTPEPLAQSSTALGTPSESAISGNPFTPDGTGTVMDNATSGDGKEFFTVKTPDGNEFYLIVDRQRDSQNVYLLNAVNEDDLASLAKPGDGKSVSVIPTPSVTPTPEPQTTVAPTFKPEPAPEKSGNNNSMLIFVGIAVAVIGGAAYYFKIVRPKKNGASTADDDESEDDFSDDKEFDVETDDEDGDDE